MMWRTLVITHRYLGVAVGALMVMWFLSGIVMMYVGFPRVTETDRLRILEPIAWSMCCRSGVGSIAGDDQVLAASIENLAGAPSLTLRRPGRPDTTLDLAHDAVVRVDAARAEVIAREAAPRVTGRPGTPEFTGQVQTDQWTVGRLVRDRPLFRFEFDDPARTILYVSGTSGRVVHWTTATQRFWNWLGAIPHWLYFADLRSDVALWSEIVIWTSIIGTFLTAIGLYIGICQLRLKPTGKISPYRGWFYWHHMIGLAFGVVTLTWVVSGLISMNPWGFLDSRGSGAEQARIAGEPLRWNDVRMSLEDIRTQAAVVDSVRVAAVPFDGRLYWLVTRRDGETARIDAAGQAAPLSTGDLVNAAGRIGAGTGTGVAEQGLIAGEDDYFLRRDDPRPLPVYRVILSDPEQTRYYLDPSSGSLLQRIDANGRWHRWLFGGLHRIDFTSWMRARPTWDVIVLFLMSGGLALAITGFYLGLRRVWSDVVRVIRVATRRVPAAPPTALRGKSDDR
jgi:PepSY-associated TM region